MAVTATRSTTIVYSVDVIGTQTLSAASNTASPGMMELVTLASGNTTVTVPTGGSTPVAVTIVPPTANTTAITFRGVAGDTGVRLHNTDPTTIALHSSVTTFVLNTGGAITGVRYYWT